MKKLLWLWKRFWGREYRIIYTDKLIKNRVLVYGHKIYVGTTEK